MPPWEKYKKTEESGPWAKYATQEVAPEKPPKGFLQKASDLQNKIGLKLLDSASMGLGSGVVGAGVETIQGKPVLGAAIRGAAEPVLLGQQEKMLGLIPGVDVAEQEARTQQLFQEAPNAANLGYTLGNFFSPLSKFVGTQMAGASPAAQILSRAGANVTEGQLALPPNTEDNLLNRGKIALTDLLASIGAPLIERAGTPVDPNAPYRANVKPEAVNAQREFGETSGKQVPMALDDLTKSKLQDTVGAVLREAPFVRHDFRTIGEKGQEAVYGALDAAAPGLGRQNVVGAAGLPEQKLPPKIPEGELANRIQKARDTYDKGVTQQFAPRYAELDADPNLPKANAVEDFSKTNEYLKEWNKQFKDLILPKLKTTPRSIVKKILFPINDKPRTSTNPFTKEASQGAYGKQISYKELHILRKGINEVINNLPNDAREAHAAARELKFSIDADIDALGNKPGSEALALNYQKLRQVNAEYGEARKKSDVALLDEIERAVRDPGSEGETRGFRKLQLATKEKRFSEIKKTLNLADPETKRMFHDRMWQYFTRGDMEGYDIFSGQAGKPETNSFVKRTKDYTLKDMTLLVGDERRAAHLMGIKKLAPFMSDALRVQDNAKAPYKGSTVVGGLLGGSMIVAKAIGATMAGAAGTALTGVSGGLLMAKLTSKMMTDPASVEKLIRIGKRPVGSREAINLIRAFLKEETPDKNVGE